MDELEARKLIEEAARTTAAETVDRVMAQRDETRGLITDAVETTATETADRVMAARDEKQVLFQEAQEWLTWKALTRAMRWRLAAIGVATFAVGVSLGILIEHWAFR